MSLKQRLTDDMKAAMKSGDKASLCVIRLMLAAIKQREVDERIELDDAQVLAALDRMVKQRRDSVSQYEAAIIAAIDAAVTETGAASAADIGKLMGVLKPRLAGQADMGLVSKLVKQRLAG